LSLLKTTLPAAARMRVPVSWSPLVKMRTSGAGLAGAVGGAAFWALAERLRKTARRPAARGKEIFMTAIRIAEAAAAAREVSGAVPVLAPGG